MLVCRGEVRESGLTGVTRNHVSPCGSGGSNPPLSAIQSVEFTYNPEKAANKRVGGLIRSAGGSGESDQSCKSPIFPDSSLFRRDSVPRADSVRSRPDASPFARSKVLGGSEAKRPGPLIRKEALLRVPFDRNTGLSLQTLG